MKKKYITPAFTPLPLPHVRLLITSVEGDTEFVLGDGVNEEPR